MKSQIISIFISLLLSTVCAGMVANKDSLDKPSIKYSKKEWQKESNDLKSFDKQIKEWKKAVKKPNPDYLNTLYSRLMTSLYKEHNELSTRISGRSKKMHPGQRHHGKDSLRDSEKPKVYNPELKDQPERLSKDQIMKQKAESDYLSLYITLVKAESNLLMKFKNVEPFGPDTKSTVYMAISEDLNQFKTHMKAELDYMKAETAKK
ncbi:MAG: hypothetical protein IPM34_03835 [Saprospiraceae bacterium]|nr:hypothetical protein [Saprospiraceae bacterium]